MANIGGAFTLGASYNVTAESPLDVRTLVRKESDLIAENSWGDSHPPYKGMTVVVEETGNVYVLIDPANVHSMDGWKKVGADSDSIPFEKGEVDNSAVLKGEYLGKSNKAISLTSIALGAATTAGMKGWYYSNIDFTNNTITFSDVQPHLENGVLVGGSWSSDIPNISIDDELTIINNSIYDLKSKVVAVNNNIITVDNIPFDSYANVSIESQDVHDWVIYVPAKPNNGIINLGFAAHAEGVVTKATAPGAHSEGLETHAYGHYSHTEGRDTMAGYAAHAEGRRSIARGEHSHAQGLATIAEGNNSFTTGRDTKAYGDNSSALGYKSESHGENSLSSGITSKAKGVNSVALGNNVNAEGDNTFAEGNNTINKGNSSHTEGLFSKVDVQDGELTDRYHRQNGYAAHAEGYTSLAVGCGAHSEGMLTKAIGAGAHSEGYRTIASGGSSHVEGSYTETKNSSEHAEGEYNISNEGKTIHSVGIGTSSKRKNAHEIMLDGKHYVYGIGGYDGTNPTESDDLAKIINGNTEANLSKLVNPYWLEQGFLEQPVDPHFRTPVVFYYTPDGVSSLRSEVRPIEIWRCNRLISLSEASIYVKMMGTMAVSGTEAAYLPASISINDGFFLIWEDKKYRYELLIDNVNTQPKITLKSDSAIIPITYSELVDLRDSSKLIPGQQYRITDYVTTTVQENTQSAGHQFDIIVTADDEKTLNEEARVCLHDEDTYFANSNLSAWKAWYCLDNDSTRFVWAAPDNGETTVLKLSILNHTEEPIRCSDKDMIIGDTKYYCWKHKYGAELSAYTSTEDPSPETPVLTPEFIDYDENGKSIYEMIVFESAYFINETVISEPGKGVIYRLIDEFGNDLPYDFKNILYLADYDKVKMIIEYDYSGRLKDKIAELVYSDDRNVKIHDADSESDTMYYAWRVYNTDGVAEGVCFTLTPFDCVDSNTTIYEYIPPTDEEIEAAKKAYEDAKSIQETSALFMEGGENLIEPLSIEAGIGGNSTTVIGKFVELSNIRIIDIHKGLKQYTFGDEYSDIEELTDYSMNTVKEKSVINNVMQPLFSNGKYVLNNNLFTFASNNIILSNCGNIDKSSLTFETEDDVKSTNDTEFAKAYSQDSSNVMESIEMDYDYTYSLCLNYFYNNGYGYGYGGGSEDTPWIVDIPTGDFVCRETTSPMDVVFSNENGDKIITNDFTTVPDGYDPIGVVVIPARHDVYGTGECCVMSLNKMSCNTPDTGSIDNDSDEMHFGYSTENSSLHSYTSVPITNDGGFSWFRDYSHGYLPSDLFGEDNTLCDPLTSYESKSTYLIPSPYLGSDRNPIYYDDKFALSDVNGKENTRILTDLITVPNWKTNDIIVNSNSIGNYPAAACCWRYSTLGTSCGDWYLPAIGEVGYILVRRKAINKTLTNVKKYFNKHTQEQYRDVWSSTKYSNNCQWACYSDRVDYYSNDIVFYVRACYRLKP